MSREIAAIARELVQTCGTGLPLTVRHRELIVNLAALSDAAPEGAAPEGDTEAAILERGRKAWADVPDAAEWQRQIRGTAEPAAPASGDGLNFRGETFAEARQQLVNVLKAQKSWLTGYAEVYVDEFAALASPTGVDAAMASIGALIRTQDNRCTASPIFIVQQRRGKHWDFVTACFTEQGCKDYLARDGHNLKEPRIYAAGSYRNSEWQAVRNYLAALAAQDGGAGHG
jgi:hypothetical protein